MSENKGKIIYSLVAKGVKPLAGYSNYTGTFDQACINYLKQIGPISNGVAKLDDYLIIFINENNITYLLMTDNSFPKETGLACLQSIQKEFEATYQGRDFDGEMNFGLNDEFREKLKMKFDYFNKNQDVKSESAAILREKLVQFHSSVVEASGLLEERGEKIKVLDEKADSLSRDSSTFYNQSKRVKRAEMMRKIKLYAAIACVLIVILLLIYFIVF